MKIGAIVDYDETSFVETAKVLMKVNPLDWENEKNLISYMKHKSVDLMQEQEDRQFLHWGTAGFYVSIFPQSGDSSKYWATATLMPFTVAKALNV